jgi:aspartyl-tRNA(Asn)/glutamyl-tRNA(Gln) amidotransferase subunit A
MPAVDPTTLSLGELAHAYREGSLTPTGVLDAYLDRLEIGPIYRLLTPDRAAGQAREAERLFAAGVDIGPLQGVPLAIKDLLDTRGDVTAAGSTVLSRNPPASEDSPVAARLDAAGAVFLGKTGMTELAFSGLGINPHYGTPGNAADPERIPGGSSSGSAVAVASGLACAAVGSDTGGSVRIPASLNGIVGLKTTDGLIPIDGAVPLSTTLDTLGPMARTVSDCWTLLQAMRAAPPRPLPTAPSGLTFLAPTTVLQEGLDPEPNSNRPGTRSNVAKCRCCRRFSTSTAPTAASPATRR